MPDLTKEQRQKYVNEGGVYCPDCGSPVEATGQDTYDSTDRYYQRVRCSKCGRLFAEVYVLQDIQVISEPASE